MNNLRDFLIHRFAVLESSQRRALVRSIEAGATKSAVEILIGSYHVGFEPSAERPHPDDRTHEQWLKDHGITSQMFCNHANECPHVCPCAPNCECRLTMCAEHRESVRDRSRYSAETLTGYSLAGRRPEALASDRTIGGPADSDLSIYRRITTCGACAGVPPLVGECPACGLS